MAIGPRVAIPNVVGRLSQVVELTAYAKAGRVAEALKRLQIGVAADDSGWPQSRSVKDSCFRDRWRRIARELPLLEAVFRATNEKAAYLERKGIVEFGTRAAGWLSEQYVSKVTDFAFLPRISRSLRSLLLAPVEP